MELEREPRCIGHNIDAKNCDYKTVTINFFPLFFFLICTVTKPSLIKLDMRGPNPSISSHIIKKGGMEKKARKPDYEIKKLESSNF